MALRPVSGDSIREGIEEINAAGPARYASILAAVFGRWARENPEAALAAASQLRDPGAKMALVWKVFESASSASYPDILAKAMAQPQGIARSAAFAAITESVPVERIREVLQQSIAGIPPHHLAFDSFQERLLRKAAQADRTAPLRLALEIEEPSWRAGLLRAALFMTDSSDKTEWTATFSKLAQDPRNAEGLLYHMARTLEYNANEAISLLDHWPPPNRQKLLSEAFSNAFMKLPEGSFRPPVSQENLATLIRYAEDQGGPGYFRNILTEAALLRGAQGLDETAQWLATRGDSTGIDDLTRRATQSEPFTTARWLATLSSSPDRDRAVAVFAETHAATDPESATTWAESIADPGKREATLTAARKIAPK